MALMLQKVENHWVVGRPEVEQKKVWRRFKIQIHVMMDMLMRKTFQQQLKHENNTDKPAVCWFIASQSHIAIH